jgi:VCBS repeat-containing protein
MKKNIIAITIGLLLTSPQVFSGLLFIDPSEEESTTTSIEKQLHANDDFAALVIGTQKSTTGNVLDNDQNTENAILIVKSSLIGKYGVLALLPSGAYTYTLFQDGTKINQLTLEKQVKDIFTYVATNTNNEQSTATLTIEIISKISSKPTAINDTASLVIGVQTIAAGNLINNDFNTTGVIIKGSLIGQYGALALETDGRYSYTIFESGIGIESLKTNQHVKEIFNYTAFNAINQQSSAQLIIEIISKKTVKNTPSSITIARNDSVTVRANSIKTATGNVTQNDSSRVSETQGNQAKSVQLNSPTSSQYGFLDLKVDGVFTYTLYDNAPSVSALKFGDIALDAFNYTYFDEFGQSATATLNVSIIGNPVDALGNTLYNGKIQREFLDTFTIIDKGETAIPTVTNKVTNRTNENNAKSFQLKSAAATKNGYINFKSDGNFLYTLYRNAPSVLALRVGDTLSDSFSYTYIDPLGREIPAKMTISILGNPLDAAGNTIFTHPNQGSLFDNVDVEFNDRSAQATPLTSSKNVRGHLHHTGDKDWYSLSSQGDEVITLEMCPRGSSCFGQKNWVLYVFDSQKLTKAMEEKTYIFERKVDETGSRNDLAGNPIISGLSSAGESNHMYLAYHKGYFNGALIGIVDPCFDKTNAVHIGVDATPRNYVFAVSSALKGTGDGCGSGTVILERKGASVIGTDAATPPQPKKYETTEKYISIFPASDDQYTINIKGTGQSALLSPKAVVSSATFDSANGQLIIPKINIFNDLYEAKLTLDQASASGDALSFLLTKLTPLPANQDVSTYHATYDSNNKQVIIPRVTNKSDGKAYSVILQYFSAANGKPDLLKVVSMIVIE